MQQVIGRTNPWLVEHIRSNYHQLSRYDIDLFLINCGYDPKEIEAAWQEVLYPPRQTSRPALSFKMPKAPNLFSLLMLFSLGAIVFGLFHQINTPSTRVTNFTDRAFPNRNYDAALEKTFLPDSKQDDFYAMAFSPDGSSLVAAGKNDLTVGNLRTGVAEVIPGLSESAVAMAFSPDGKQLAVLGITQIQIWNMESRKSLATFRYGDDWPSTLAFSPDGKILAVGNEKGVIELLDATDNYRPIDFLQGHKGSVTSLAFSPDDKLLASAAQDQSVIIWSVEDHKPIQSIIRQNGTNYKLAFSPDSQKLAIASSDGVQVRDLNSFENVKSFVTPVKSKDPTPAKETTIGFSRDGKYLLSSYQDSLFIWETGPGMRSIRVQKSGGIINELAISPDGKKLAILTNSHQISLLDMQRLLTSRSGQFEVIRPHR
jgi:WD40 repeat protein